MLRVLIADDHEIVRRGIKQILLEGFSHAYTEEADNTTTLVNKAVNGQWDIVISDLVMPGGGGLDALQKIKQQVPGLPVLIISIYPEEQYADRVIKAGAEGYLAKDATPDKLVKTVKQILSGKLYVAET